MTMTKEEATVLWNGLGDNAKEVLGQLYLNGPQYDGHVASKVGRDQLRDLEFIERGFGWQWLTRVGVEVANLAPVADWFDGRWRKKQCA